DELACAVPASPLPGHSEAISVADRTAITAKSSNRYRGVLELPGEYLAIALLLYVDVDPGQSDGVRPHSPQKGCRATLWHPYLVCYLRYHRPASPAGDAGQQAFTQSNILKQGRCERHKG